MKLLSRMSIRARLTIGSLLIATLIFGVALIAARAQIAGVLLTADETLARGDLISFATEISSGHEGTVDNPGQGVLVYIRDPAGAVRADTVPTRVGELLKGRREANESFTARIVDDSYVIVGRSIESAKGEWSLWAVRSRASSELALQGLDGVLAVGAIALLALFGLASWLLASAALRPVTRLRRGAELLSTSPGGNLPVGPAHDEIADLAATLNTFVGNVRRSAERERQMVSDAAHELRTPLSVLKTQLELAHDDFGDSGMLASRVVAAESTVDRLSALATNLLALSRLDDDSVQSQSSTAEELVTTLMASVDRARLLGLHKSVQIGLSFDSTDDSARFSVSAENFARLLDNLLANAIAAVGLSGTIEVSSTQSDTGLVARVADNGTGMAEDFLPHAFERFSRPDDSRTSGTGGSGLGLALVKAIAVGASGTVSLENVPPGLVVIVTLPSM